jgi:hypothetical protein
MFGRYPDNKNNHVFTNRNIHEVILTPEQADEPLCNSVDVLPDDANKEDEEDLQRTTLSKQRK